MNTGKQVNAMVLVLFLTLIALGAYTIWDPFRSDSAEDEQLEQSAVRAATTFALNCRLCHGDRGQGGVNGGRLPAAPALNITRLQGIENGVFSQAGLAGAADLVFNTITCGRVGTAMPTWGQSQGGILSGEQIRQLTVLITERQGEFWELAQEHADEIDAETTAHATVEMPSGALGVSETELIVSDAGSFSLGQYIRIDEERLRVRRNELEVTRGVAGTEALAHESGTSILRETESAVTDSGQTLRGAVTPDDTVLAVADLKGFAVGDTLQLGDEIVRITDIVTGLPTTGQRLAEETGRAPDEFLVSGSDGLETGQIVRLKSELLEVTAIRDDGDPGIELDDRLSASADTVSVNDPVFFDSGYVLRLDNELIEVVGPVETGQALGDGVGRAETTLSISGTEGIEIGSLIRIGRKNELLRVIEIVEPARLELERGAVDTQAASHGAGTAILRPPEEDGATAESTGQTLSESVDANATFVAVSGTSGVAVDDLYELEDEVVRIVDSQPARIRVERGVDGTDRATHPRRSTIYAGNLLEVERGVAGTRAQSHDDGAAVFLTVVEVKRGVESSARDDHSKNDEIYLGQRLIVDRGVLNTEAEEHANGTIILDFPPPPSSPSITEQACGQIFAGVAEPTGPTATPLEGAQDVAVSLIEFDVIPETPSIVDGPVAFQVTNDGAAVHDFRVIATDLAADELPLDGATVDEESADLEVLGSVTSLIGPGGSQTVAAELPPGGYVLICNVPGHYESGMFVGFDVTAP